MIVAFDASVLVRAISRSSGPARRVMDLIAADEAHVIALSPYILGELGRVLSYPRLQALYGLTADEIHEHIDSLRSLCRIIEPDRGLPVVLSDPADDPVIYTAVAAGADVLCTKDRDFHDPNVLRFCAEQGISVMDDVELLNLLESRRPTEC